MNRKILSKHRQTQRTIKMVKLKLRDAPSYLQKTTRKNKLTGMKTTRNQKLL